MGTNPYPRLGWNLDTLVTAFTERETPLAYSTHTHTHTCTVLATLSNLVCYKRETDQHDVISVGTEISTGVGALDQMRAG